MNLTLLCKLLFQSNQLAMVNEGKIFFNEKLSFLIIVLWG